MNAVATVDRRLAHALGQGDFPFLLVQLPNWQRPGDPMALPALRQAQQVTATRVPNTAMAVTIDLGNPLDVHPKGKLHVGLRLARLARRDVYGESDPASGPVVERIAFEGSAARIRFTAADGGLVIGRPPWLRAGRRALPT